MRADTLSPKKITANNFKSYGCLIDYPQRKKAIQKKNLFKIVLKQHSKGWRIAYLVVRDRFIERIEQHPDSCESFEPVRGKGLLFVAKNTDRGCIACFYLDRPVILKKGVWHGVVTQTKEFDVKIVENNSVQCVYHPLKKRLC